MRNNSGMEVFGEVRNDQPRELRGVLVAIAFYDAQKRVIEMGYSYATVTTFGPGSASIYRTFRDSAIKDSTHNVTGISHHR